MKTFIYTLILFFLVTPLFSQAGMYTEQEIKEQTDFIDALSMIFDEDYNEAIEKLDELIESEPRKATLYAERAQAYAMMENYDKAYNDINKAIRFDNEKLNFYQIKFGIEAALENYDAQISTCKKLVSLQPNNIYNYYDLFNAYRAANRSDQALYELDNIIEIFGYDERVVNSKVKLLREKNDDSSITQTLEQYLRIYPEEIPFMHKLAGHLLGLGETEKGMSIIQDILKINPSDAKAMLAVNRSKRISSEGSEDLSSLLDMIKDSNIDINPKIMELIPYVQNMSMDPQKEENIQLETLLGALKEAHPENAKAYSISGDFFFNSGQFELAIRDYRQTIELNDSVFDVWIQLLNAFYFIDDFALLGKYAEQAIDLYPNKLEGYYFASLAQVYDDNPTEALAYSKEASFIAGKQEYWMQKFTSIHAHILYHDNKNDEAILSLEGVNTLLQQDAITAKLFGDAKFKTGDKPTAVKYWKLASTLGFNTSALKEQIHAAGS